jgi:hypothetical protein
MRKVLVGGVLAVVLLFAGQAQASMIGANITITTANGLPFSCKDGYSATTVGAGTELAASNWTGGCVGYYAADVDASALTLTNIEWGNYTRATLDLHVVSGPTIVGVAFLGYSNGFFDATWDGGLHTDSNFLPFITFSASDISIVWDTYTDRQFAFNNEGFLAPSGTARFEILTSDGRTDPVPEPASMLLFGTGLIGAVRAARKRRQ